jgi:hypothetical protein
MSTCGYTSIVYNNPNKLVNLSPYYYRWRTTSTLNGNTPADQYQKLKLIQNTARVNGSLYTSNLGPLNAYVKPTKATYGVCWNQMSDRPVPSVQKATVPTGTNNSLNRRHTSVTSSRPGCQTPGGIGCDIKHNSYDRYLNRLKGKGPLRRGVVPLEFGKPLPFNPAFPIYGGKTVKTNIVSGCDCPIGSQQVNLKQDERIYNNPLWQPYPSGNCSFQVGNYVYAIENNNTFYSRALVISVDNGVYTIQFDDKTTQVVTDVNELLIYFPCNNCFTGQKTFSTSAGSGKFTLLSELYSTQCFLPYSVLSNTAII